MSDPSIYRKTGGRYFLLPLATQTNILILLLLCKGDVNKQNSSFLLVQNS